MSMIGSNDKLKQAAAGAAGGGEALNVEDVFSTYLWEGNSTLSRSIVNGIDVSGEGGLVWIKDRTLGDSHSLFTTDRGANKTLLTNETDAEDTVSTSVFESFNSDGFTVGNHGRTNENNRDYASWTFRKAPKFFDVVTYTGDGVAGRTVSHNLGSAPGVIIVKNTSSSSQWPVWHRSSTLNLELESNAAAGAIYIDTVTSTSFNLPFASTEANANGDTYVAYLFAHNDGDGEFGPDGDQDIIKCGSFPWGSTSGTEVDLGFEPQWILFKAADQAGKNWFIFDAMRGIVTGGFSGDGDAALFPNTSGAENVNTWGVDLTPTGFIAYGNNIASSGNIIYIAIRRGTKVPESATEVFGIDSNTGQTGMQTGILNDMGIAGGISNTDKWYIGSRLTQGLYLQTNTTAAEPSGASAIWNFDSMDSFFNGTTWNGYIGYGWKRAPNFFDVVAYTGNGTAGRTVSHNLGVAPEMMWVKNRDNANDWNVWHSALTATQSLRLNLTNAVENNSWFTASPTDQAFFTNSYQGINASGNDYIAYLFASLPGISKVGSVSHINGTDTNVDCGFSSGARFILLKRTDGASSWYVWDTERGIVAGDDKVLYLQSTLAEQTGDSVDPLSSGFTMVGGSFDTGDYIFYAIA